MEFSPALVANVRPGLDVALAIYERTLSLCDLGHSRFTASAHLIWYRLTRQLDPRDDNIGSPNWNF